MANTPISDLYANFFQLIDGISLHNLQDELKEILLEGYLKRTLALECRNLTYPNAEGEYFKIKFEDIISGNILNELDEIIGTQKVFPYEIPLTEQWIIAHGMVIGWLTPKINRERLLRESLGDRDYKESSHGNQLQQLMKLFENAKYEIEQFKLDHSFDGFEGFN